MNSILLIFMSVEVNLIQISKDEYQKIISENKNDYLNINYNYFSNRPYIELFLSDTELRSVQSILDYSLDDFIADINLQEVV